MQRKIELEGEEIEYTLKESRRARQMRLSIYQDGRFVVTIPRFFSERKVERFILQKSNWIIRAIARFKALPRGLAIRAGRGDFVRHKERALILARERLEHFNSVYGFSYSSISIRNQKTRWGSCSRGGALNFNYKIALLPETLVDYVIVHELCHLGEFNHSKDFWRLVALTTPDYKEKRRALKHLRFI